MMVVAVNLLAAEFLLLGLKFHDSLSATLP